MIKTSDLVFVTLTGGVSAFIGGTAVVAASRNDWPWFFIFALFAIALAGLTGGLAYGLHRDSVEDAAALTHRDDS